MGGGNFYNSVWWGKKNSRDFLTIEIGIRRRTKNGEFLSQRSRLPPSVGGGDEPTIIWAKGLWNLAQHVSRSPTLEDKCHLKFQTQEVRGKTLLREGKPKRCATLGEKKEGPKPMGAPAETLYQRAACGKTWAVGKALFLRDRVDEMGISREKGHLGEKQKSEGQLILP